MEQLTIKDFMNKYNVTLSQVIAGKRSGNLDYIKITFENNGRGGKTSETLILINDKIPEFLLQLRGHKKKALSSKQCRNGVSVLNNIMGKVATGHY